MDFDEIIPAYDSSVHPHIGYSWTCKYSELHYSGITPKVLVDYKSPVPEYIDVCIRTTGEIYAGMCCRIETIPKSDEPELDQLDGETTDEFLERLFGFANKKSVTITYGQSVGCGAAGYDPNAIVTCYYSTLLIETCKHFEEIDVIIAILETNSSDVCDIDYLGHDATYYAKTPEIKDLIQRKQATVRASLT